MGRKMVVGLVMVLMCASSFMGMVDVSSGTGPRVETTLDDGLVWSEDIRVTNNPSPDTIPYLFLDPAMNNHIVWTRSNAYMYKRLGPDGKGLLNERQVTSGEPIMKNNGQYGRAVAVDGSGNIHVIHAEGDPLSVNRSLVYEKLDQDGEVLRGPLDAAIGLGYSSSADMMLGQDDVGYVLFDHYHLSGKKMTGLSIIYSTGNLVVDIGGSSWYVEGTTMTIDHDGDVRALLNVWSGGDPGVWAITTSKGAQSIDPPQHIYSTDANTFPRMPAMAACPDNTLGLLRPSVPGSEGVLTFMKLGPRNRPVHEITVSDTASGTSDIACDASGNFYVAYTDDRDGFLYYAKIMRGKENDTVRPIKMTNTGSAKDPRIVVDRIEGIHMVWVDDRNGNDEIYYKSASNHGLELKMDPQAVAKMMFIHCGGEIKSANVTVKNLGGQNDTIWLNLSINYNGLEENGWDAWLSTKELSMGGHDTDRLTVSVRSPDFSHVNDFITVFINATSGTVPSKNASISFKVFTMACTGISIDCADNVHVSGVGNPTEFVVTVSIQSDIPTEVVVWAEGPVDWRFEIEPAEFTAEPSKVHRVKFLVYPPDDGLAHEIGVFRITAHFKDAPYIKDSATIFAIIAPMASVSLLVDQPIRQVDPGGRTDFMVSIHYMGNLPGTRTFIIDLLSGVGDWGVYIEPNVVALDSNTLRTVKVSVWAPPDAMANEHLVLKLRVGDCDHILYERLTVTAIVDPVHDLKVSVKPTRSMVWPGEMGTYDVTIENKGNAMEHIDLAMEDVPDGWYTGFSIDGLPIDDLVLGPGEELGLQVTVKVHSDELAGQRELWLQVFGGDGHEVSTPMTVDVGQNYKMELESTVTKQIGLIGGYVTFPISVHNLGNGHDRMGLTIGQGLPGTWNARFLLDERPFEDLTVGPGRSEEVTLEVEVPKAPLTDRAIFEVLGHYSDNGTTRIVLEIGLDMPNLEIISVEYGPEGVGPGQLVDIEVIVMNSGWMAATDVLVTLYIDDMLVTAKVLGWLSSGSTAKVVLNWTPTKAREYDLRLVVDPDQTIMELDETDNQVTGTVLVKGEQKNQPGFEGAFLILAILVTTLVTVIGHLRKE